MFRPTSHAVTRPGQHYPSAVGAPSPVDALQEQQQQRANTSATRQQLVRLYLGGMQNQRPTLGAF